MSFEEKGSWIQALVVVLVPGVYFAMVFSQVPGTPVAEIDYQVPMLASIVVAIALLIVAYIAIAIVSRTDAGQSDERDKEINRFGEHIGQVVL